MEATPKALVVGLMKAKVSPNIVEEGFMKAEEVPTVAEGITKTVPNLAEGLTLLPNVTQRIIKVGPRWWKGS